MSFTLVLTAWFIITYWIPGFDWVNPIIEIGEGQGDFIFGMINFIVCILWFSKRSTKSFVITIHLDLEFKETLLKQHFLK